LTVDLVLVTVGGVQRFLAESRKTVDLAGASLAVRHVVIAAAGKAHQCLGDAEAPAGLVFPPAKALSVQQGTVPVGVTNKIVFLAPHGAGPGIARKAVDAAAEKWNQLVGNAYGNPAQLPDTPGMPDLAWVCATGDDQPYPELWERAQALWTQRRRARIFVAGEWKHRALCAQSPAVPAGPVPPNGIPKRDRKEPLSVAGWTKRYVGNRAYPPGQRFPSTTVIASSSFRKRLVLRAAADPAMRAELSGLVGELRAILPGDASAHRGLPGVQVPAELDALSTWLGTGISPDAWEPNAARGEYDEGIDEGEARKARRLAREIGALARRHDVPALSAYYAIVMQDLDKLGTAIGKLRLDVQRVASDALTRLGTEQLSLSERHLGVPVYAGGDDFLAFAPAADALGLATELRTRTADLLSAGPLSGVTASTVVVFAHMTSPLQTAVATAQEALKQAKNAVKGGRQRDALSVVVVRRGGERARTIQPWSTHPNSHDAADTLGRVAPAAAPSELSARLAARLEHDQAELDHLATDSTSHWALDLEVLRLVKRQGGTQDVAAALTALGRAERGGGEQFFRPVPAALVGRFLTQECR
jgi:CRISPR-associated protein Cmr2